MGPAGPVQWLAVEEGVKKNKQTKKHSPYIFKKQGGGVKERWVGHL